MHMNTVFAVLVVVLVSVVVLKCGLVQEDLYMQRNY